MRTRAPVCLLLAQTAYLLFISATAFHAEPNPGSAVGLGEVAPASLLLRAQTPEYVNYAHRHFANYSDHAPPYADHPRAYFGAMGNHLLNGYELFSWTENRGFDKEYGSAIFKDINVFRPIFDHVLVGRDGYGDWGYSLIVADDMIARFTPLTLSKAAFNGVRLDAHLPRLQVTLLGSRFERPWHWTEEPVQWMVEDVHLADTSTMMLGARAQTQVGALKLGLNGVNLHVYQSTQPGNSLKGVIRPTYPRIGWLGVRFSDDSPVDGQGGAVVQDLKIIVNGEERPDITHHLIKHNSLVKTAVGSISSATGEFRPLSYRGRSGLSFYADYLYRIQHEQGIDVSSNTNVELLENTFIMRPPGSVLQADGEDWVIALYDLREVPVIEEIEIEALVANDYRIDVFFLTVISERAKDEARRWATSSWINRLRAPGNIQDLTNLERVRFSFGETTGLLTYSADAELKLQNLEIKAEYARSAQFSRYPSYDGETPVFRKAPHALEHGSAYFINATSTFNRGLWGAELFTINPQFKTRMFSRRDGVSANEYVGVGRSGMFAVDLVEDNDDGDQMSENGHRPIGTPSNRGDLNGVFLNQDVDNDGIPDTNRNFNDTPDWDEPFFMFDADPNEYAYGLDRNNNDEPDQREDDGDADYPYDADQRGVHLFGQVHPTEHWSVAVGRYQARQIAGPGRNQAVYGLASYRRRSVGQVRRLFFESNLRRVKDNIQDPYVSSTERPTLGLYFDYRGYEAVRGAIQQALIFQGVRTQTDFLLYQNSIVNETNLEADLRPLPDLELSQRLRVRLNWQQESNLPGGISQTRRRLDYWTLITRGTYTWHWGRLMLRPRLKLMLLRLVDQDADRLPGGKYASRRLISEYRMIPILLVSYPIMPRTDLKLGLQGFGPAPYRVEDQVDKARSFEQRIGFFTVTNRSLYFGYDLHTTLGLERNTRTFDDPFRQSSNIDTWSFFLRALIGFTEYGRVI
jgi:hypothetical protein